MSYDILQTVGTYTNNTDSAAINRHYSRHVDGIMQGILNECPLTKNGQNGIIVGTGFINIAGFIFRIFEPKGFLFTESHSTTEQWQLVCQVTVGEILRGTSDKSRDITPELFVRKKADLIQDDLYAPDLTPPAIYQLEIGTFKLNPDLTITNLFRTMQITIPGQGSPGINAVIIWGDNERGRTLNVEWRTL